MILIENVLLFSFGANVIAKPDNASKSSPATADPSSQVLILKKVMIVKLQNGCKDFEKV